MPPVTSVRQSNCLSLLRSYKNHEPIIEPGDIPLPAIRESYLGERKKVVRRARHQLRGVFVPIKLDLRPKTCPHCETLRLRECAVDDIVVQKVPVFLFRLGRLRFRDQQL
jgi:hypothetical protein